ncbi:PREDICTED: uncharacterized protein LOC104610489 isoform X2 [Nelumbo nucifera]|uniref:Uncharacterized protein LOC104610489 isoform X2 n=1 Tax=Nelumbo nucifera TaxID=4432 RepID=A0A1U8BF86_NELNU|nr:PREDICTED: uncharacterized protein LOC104610489 isoform X2 [Nelumbo nucifera]
MERWSGVLKVTLDPSSRAYYRVAASLCLAPSSKSLTIPSAHAIFFNGDRVEGTGNPVIERLSDLQNLTDILVSKLGASVNAWVIESSIFNGPFAVYKDFIPSVNYRGEPKTYSPHGFPASTSIVLLLSKCLEEAQNVIPGGHQKPSSSCPRVPKTVVLGFSKGGAVLNQIVTELAYSSIENKVGTTKLKQPVGGNFSRDQEEEQIIPNSKESFLSSISEIHYVDVGLNSAGAYLTDPDVVSRISEHVMGGGSEIHFGLHGTPRQWCDGMRSWIRNEKDRLLHLLQDASKKSGGKLKVCEKFYFADKRPDMQMHFEIIERLDMS